MQAQLREKEKQLRGLTSELIMEQAGVEEHKDSVTRLQRELMDMKRLWLEAKRQVSSRSHLALCKRLRRPEERVGYVDQPPLSYILERKAGCENGLILFYPDSPDRPWCDVFCDGALKSTPCGLTRHMMIF